MAFSISPAVVVNEYDLTANAPNLPSSRTGMILRADTGPANSIVAITKEKELIATFGYPTSENFNEWFQCWNFLQYAGSLYINRPVTATALNAGLVFAPGNVAGTQTGSGSLYNENLAENSIKRTSINALEIYNRWVTTQSSQAVAICSQAGSAYFEAPVAVPFQATLSASAASGQGTLAVAAGGTLEVGSTFTFSSVVYTVATVSAAAITVTTSLSANVPNATKLIGFNKLDNVFDDSMIVRQGYGSTQQQTLVTFKQLVEYEPNWAAGEFIIVVMKKNNVGKYLVAETRTVNYTAGGKDSQGRNNYANAYYYANSKYIYVVAGSGGASIVDTAGFPLQKITPAGGAITTAGSADVDAGYDLFADSESFDVNLLTCHELAMNKSATIAQTRKDCFNIVTPMSQADINYIVGHSNSESSTYMVQKFGTKDSTSGKSFSNFGTYSGIYANAKYQYDKWNDVNRWVSIAGDIAGLCAQTDATHDTWWAVAGVENGKIKNAIKLAFNPNKSNRDDMYYNSLNSVISIPGEGIAVVYGQKTATGNSSAFDRMNVRRLMIHVEKTIATASRVGLFQFNDSFTRSRLVGIIDPFLRSVKSRRGIFDYKLIIDESNNTPEVIDQNGLVIDVYVKPTRVAEFIQINAVVVKTGVDFNEVIGGF
jgi:hypothetical protein